MLETLFYKLRGDKPLVVKVIGENHVEIPSAFRNVYGARIISTNEFVLTIDQRIESLIRLSYPKADRYLFVVMARDREASSGLLYTEGYVLSYEPTLLNSFINVCGQKNFQKLKGYELANVLFRLHSVKRNIFLTPDYRIRVTGEPFTKEDRGPVDLKYYGLSKEINPKDIRVFVGSTINNKRTDWEMILSTEWTGVLWVILNLNNLEFFIKEKGNRGHRKVFKEMEEKYKTGQVKYVGVSTYFFTREEEGLEETVPLIFEGLGFETIEKTYAKDFFVEATPLLAKDYDFQFFVAPEIAGSYAFYQYEKNKLPETVSIYGRNRFGNYVAFNQFEECKNPHALILAPSGTGKSVFMQGMTRRILRVDIEKLVRGIGHQSLPNVRIRYFDKGYSAELFFRLLQIRGYDVDIVSPDPTKMYINPLEIETYVNEKGERVIDESDYDFAIALVNTFLVAIGSEPLVGHEIRFFRELLKKARTNERFMYYAGAKIREIARLDGLAYVYEKLRTEYGYKPEQLIKEIKEPEFEFLKQPILSDIHRLAENVNVSELTKEERAALEKMKTKIKALADTVKQIDRPSAVSFKNSQILYIDYEKLSHNKHLFVPFLLAILKKLNKIDKFGKKEDELAYYMIDEAHTLYKNSQFAQALDILIREARKYRISITLATQEIKDVPVAHFNSSDTKIFLSPKTKKDKESIASILKEHMKLSDEILKDFTRVFYNVDFRGATVLYGEGIFSLIPDFSELELQLYDSYRREFVLPDGKVIRKEAFTV